MKELVQKPGIRPWHGNELVSLQAESLSSIQSFLQPFGPMVLSGVVRTGSGPGPYDYSAGLVGIEHPTDGYKIARFAGATGAGSVGIIYIRKTVTQKLYDDGNNHDAVYDYDAVYLDAADPTFSPVINAFTPSQYIYCSIGQPDIDRLNFGRAAHKLYVQDWQAVISAPLTPASIDNFNISKRINYLTGQIHINGSITIKNSASSKWVPVVNLGLSGMFIPTYEQFFIATVRNDVPAGLYFKDFSAYDYITTIGGSVNTQGILNIFALKPAGSLPTYTVYFNTSIFFS